MVLGRALVFVALLACSSAELYNDEPAVAFLDAANIESFVPALPPLTASPANRHIRNSSVHWVVEYYASWCGHCQRFKPVFVSFAKDLAGLLACLSVFSTIHLSADLLLMKHDPPVTVIDDRVEFYCEGWGH
jgi:thiol-disulfide isomerase/thioredoxin